MTDNHQSPVRKLPAELLIQVFIYVHDKQDARNIRLVCRGFKDCAWPAFGASLVFTKFDLRSKKSMANLLALCGHADITPHVRGMTFCAGYIDPRYPGNRSYILDPVPVAPKDYLDQGIYDELLDLQIYQKDNPPYFLVDAWDWAPGWPQQPGSLEAYVQKASEGNVVEFLRSVLVKLKNLRTVVWAELQTPESFREIVPRAIANVERVFGYNGVSDKNASMDIIGIRILLQALTAANIPIRNLDIPASNVYGGHVLGIFAHKDDVENILATLETICVGNIDDGSLPEALTEDQIFPLDAIRAPKLKVLKWRIGYEDILVPLRPELEGYIPQIVSQPPPLERIEIIETRESRVITLVWSTTFFDLLAAVRVTLKNITIHGYGNMDLECLLNFLITYMSLEQLVIIGATDTAGRWRFLPKDQLYAAAKEVILDPLDLRISLEGQWLEKEKAAA